MPPNGRSRDVDVSDMIPFEHAADHLPSKSEGDHTPVSERSAHPHGEGAFPITEGRAAYHAQRPADAGSRRRGFGNPREGRGWQFPRVLLYCLITGRSGFHAFVKKTQRTPPLEIELARKRLKELLDE